MCCFTEETFFKFKKYVLHNYFKTKQKKPFDNVAFDFKKKKTKNVTAGSFTVFVHNLDDVFSSRRIFFIIQVKLESKLKC